jgi:hypothetical protein
MPVIAACVLAVVDLVERRAQDGPEAAAIWIKCADCIRDGVELQIVASRRRVNSH